MGRYGRVYPRANFHDAACILQDGGYWPRKMRIAFGHGGDGSHSAAWDNQDVDSELLTFDYSTGICTCVWKLPADSVNQLRFLWELVPQDSITHPTFQNTYFLTRQFWYGAVLQGDSAPADASPLPVPIPPGSNGLGGWFKYVGPSLFNFFAPADWQASVWSRQPDFHPYRLH